MAWRKRNHLPGVYDVCLQWQGADLGWNVEVYPVASVDGLRETDVRHPVVTFSPHIPDDVLMDAFEPISWFDNDDPHIPAWLKDQVFKATSHTRPLSMGELDDPRNGKYDLSTDGSDYDID